MCFEVLFTARWTSPARRWRWVHGRRWRGAHVPKCASGERPRGLRSDIPTPTAMHASRRRRRRSRRAPTIPTPEPMNPLPSLSTRPRKRERCPAVGTVAARIRLQGLRDWVPRRLGFAQQAEDWGLGASRWQPFGGGRSCPGNQRRGLGRGRSS
jgi:hypothetical protein